MEQLLKKKLVRLSGCALDKQEECPISGEYTLPEYCPDVAVILKCFAYPHIQNRQWSGEQWLLDGNVVVRILYLDEERRCVRCIEFTQGFSCAVKGEGRADNAAVSMSLGTKYLNCRALSPRRVEVRGAISVHAKADCSMQKDMPVIVEDDALYARVDEVETTILCGAADKVLTVGESLEFHESLPPAEMLLGGECRAVIRECKLLSGKAIVKGQVYLHQLYADDLDGGSTHCLDYMLPFSQILDVDGATEGMPCNATVQVLSDTERCSVGPDGENTMLEVSVKLLLQVQVYGYEKITILRDAYHRGYPLNAHSEEIEISYSLGNRWEDTALPMQISLAPTPRSEIIDICIQPQECTAQPIGGQLAVKGRLSVCVIARDSDGEIVYDEYVEDYALEYPAVGNHAYVRVVPTTVKYRVVEDNLEMMVGLCVEITDVYCERKEMITELRLQKDAPYPKQKMSALLYYADSGETVWNIGRICRTSPECIMEENDLTEDSLNESRILVVPIAN